MFVQKFKLCAASDCMSEKAQQFSKCAILFSIVLWVVLGFEGYEKIGALLSTQSVTDLPSLSNPFSEIPNDIAERVDTNPTSADEVELGPVITEPVWGYWPGHERNRKVMGQNRESLKLQIKKATDHGCMMGWNHSKRIIWLQMGDFPKVKRDIIVWYQLEQEGSQYARIKEFHGAMV